MKSLDDLDHYEVLEIRPGAQGDEIERAYQITRAAYADGSMALYSPFSSADADVIRSRIDEAYRILANPDDRRSYDADAGISNELVQSPSDEAAGIESPATSRTAVDIKSMGPVPTAIDVFEDLDAALDEEEQNFCGAALRRARLRRGVELRQIADVTKISTSYLKRLEGEEFDDLPAPVYVRGFVMAYAKAIGLDPQRVAANYMERLQESKGQAKRS